MVRQLSRPIQRRSAAVSSTLVALAASFLAASFLGASTGCNAMRGVNTPTDLLASSSVNRPQAVDMTAMNRTPPPQFGSPQATMANAGYNQPGMPQQGLPQQGMPQTGLAQSAIPAATAAGTIAQVSHSAPVPNACQVIIKDANGKATRSTVPLDKQYHIQDLLVKSGALKQFQRIELELLRTTPTGTKQRMNVEYDRSKRAVEMQYDYYIMPGDVLVVTEDPSTIVDDMIKKSGLVRGSSRRTNRL